MTKAVYHQTSAGFAATASAFVVESLGLIMPWLMVMAALIVGDLIAGVAKAIKLGEKVRFSRAVRDTLAKSCTYFAWVVMVCWVQVASGGETPYAEWACMIVVFIEAASIISNILKWHGYKLDFGRLVAIVLAKKLDGDAHDFEGVVKPDRKPRARPVDERRRKRPQRGWDALDAMHGRDGCEEDEPAMHGGRGDMDANAEEDEER